MNKLSEGESEAKEDSEELRCRGDSHFAPVTQLLTQFFLMFLHLGLPTGQGGLMTEHLHWASFYSSAMSRSDLGLSWVWYECLLNEKKKRKSVKTSFSKDN